jgi:hypothetical protein
MRALTVEQSQTFLKAALATHHGSVLAVVLPRTGKTGALSSFSAQSSLR